MPSNLPDQDVPSSIFNEDVSFQSIIKGSIGSWSGGGADPRVLTQEQRKHDLVPSSEGFAAIFWKNLTLLIIVNLLETFQIPYSIHILFFIFHPRLHWSSLVWLIIQKL